MREIGQLYGAHSRRRPSNLASSLDLSLFFLRLSIKYIPYRSWCGKLFPSFPVPLELGTAGTRRRREWNRDSAILQQHKSLRPCPPLDHHA